MGSLPPPLPRPPAAARWAPWRALAVLATAIALAGLAIVIVAHQDAAERRTTPPATSVPALELPSFTQLQGTIDELQTSGIVTKIDTRLKQAWVDPAPWTRATYDQKETLAFALAAYIARVNHSNLCWCTIHDNRTGKELAKYSRTFGFTVQ